MRADPVLAAVDRGLDRAIERWRAFLRIPSVGTDPAHGADTRRAADWLVACLRGAGLAADLHETAGQPMVLATDPDASDAPGPRLLYYGHYDVQPADPLELWASPPFEPVLRQGPNGPQMVARGAVDNKGQLMTIVEALAAWKQVHGRLPVPVTLFVEGEEEGVSTNLAPFLMAHRDALAADLCIISDTNMVSLDQPAVTAMLRGIVDCEVKLTGPSHDLHSGMYGGAVLNPINALVGLLAGLHDEALRVTLPGFYDTVREPGPDELAAWQGAGFDEVAFLASAGLAASTGEAGRSVLERIWSRPTLDINGIKGGYQGDGSKTVIASWASAKLSCRLVPDQDPDVVFASLERYFETAAPEGARVEIVDHGRGGPVRVPTDAPFVAAAMRAAGRVFPRPAVTIGSGVSIPVVAAMRDILGIDSLLMGFGLDDDRPHSPNEKFDLACFERGIKTHVCLLEELARERPPAATG
jgi:acetylornithine deacetylase/succinyl-diaminopimelate desuccinylase-like protein